MVTTVLSSSMPRVKAIPLSLTLIRSSSCHREGSMPIIRLSSQIHTWRRAKSAIIRTQGIHTPILLKATASVFPVSRSETPLRCPKSKLWHKQETATLHYLTSKGCRLRIPEQNSSATAIHPTSMFRRSISTRKDPRNSMTEESGSSTIR